MKMSNVKCVNVKIAKSDSFLRNDLPHSFKCQKWSLNGTWVPNISGIQYGVELIEKLCEIISSGLSLVIIVQNEFVIDL